MGFFSRFAVDAVVTAYGLQHVPDLRGAGGPLMRVERFVGEVSAKSVFVHMRPLAWHEPLFARIQVSREYLKPGELLLPWYYALGYEDLLRGHGVFFFLPVALFVRAARWVEFLWNRVRCRPSWFDNQLHRIRYGRDL
jgi:hypothetical protein